MPDEQKLSELLRDVVKLKGEVARISSDVARLEARLIAISQMIEDRDQH
jgi:hypothetical protein